MPDIDIELDGLLWKFDDGVSNCNYYSCASFQGEVILGGEEAKRNSPDNRYKLCWIPISEVKRIVLYPVEIHKRIMDYFEK